MDCKNDPEQKLAGEVSGSKQPDDGEITDRLFKAVAHHLRKQILLHLVKVGYARSATEVQATFKTPSLSTFAYHFQVLRELEIIEVASTRPNRGGTEHFCSPAPGVTEHWLIQRLLDEVDTP